MNKFIWIAQTKDGQIHIGTCKAPSGDSARRTVETHFGDTLSHCDIKGVTSDTFMAHAVTCAIDRRPDVPQEIPYQGINVDYERIHT